MSDPSKKPTAEFDHFVEGYDEKIGPLIKLTGDGREYYAENRVQLLKNKLQNLGHSSAKIMDYGCGTGIALSYLKRILAPEIIYGVDPSSLSIEDAQKENPGPEFVLSTLENYQPKGELDLVFCNGVVHHIPLNQRDRAATYVLESLKPGGIFALWDYNTYNPAIKLGMALSPVDRDAIPISVNQSKALLVKNGFQLISTSFAFFFPKFLSPLRVLDPLLEKVPIGAQYLVLAKRP
ncbi:MAG: hypothetical protein A2527_01700 [Candidatus Lambdaproteobacteria bacterium RIFOXYD2_FULL_50_16]|uniref:Methyltransferase type 11 domain-containing protein n=1 Tax=Candidatus Lambdaproteobacteria bacterium RIFOXYD2_FULL_50_16 TaxID=1817772 RepID=A0A1F6G5T0_9PROT|nr:MAG: hypothetical protein A2527_01700 [Candidatus Lambdaproteobacteria bacterium RIFOXYD2_FULL_50_16]